MICLLPRRYDVSGAVKELSSNPQLWNEHSSRTTRNGTPHSEVDDIWVRYNAIENMEADPVAFFQGEHESSWYPCVDAIPSVMGLVAGLFEDVDGAEMGGVLITRIKPGGQVQPHIDTGWHAGYYDKFAIQLMGNERQAFCFDSGSLSALPGESYTFDNSKLHWVINASDEYRMTLIVCIRRKSNA
jgi:Aspartyl/Asparaginyl beta-hydroxylase